MVFRDGERNAALEMSGVLEMPSTAGMPGTVAMPGTAGMPGAAGVSGAAGMLGVAGASGTAGMPGAADAHDVAHHETKVIGEPCCGIEMPDGVRRKAEQHEATRHVIEAHYDDVLAYCRRRAASLEDARDLTQEVFLRFFRASSRYRDEGKPLALLLTIARNVCIDAARRRRFDQVPFEEELHDFPSSDQSESLGVIAQALERLDASDREVLELRYDQGLGVSEIAQVLGISRFSASRRIRRALAEARKALEEEGFRWDD